MDTTKFKRSKKGTNVASHDIFKLVSKFEKMPLTEIEQVLIYRAAERGQFQIEDEERVNMLKFLCHFVHLIAQKKPIKDILSELPKQIAQFKISREETFESDLTELTKVVKAAYCKEFASNGTAWERWIIRIPQIIESCLATATIDADLKKNLGLLKVFVKAVATSCYHKKDGAHEKYMNDIAKISKSQEKIFTHLEANHKQEMEDVTPNYRQYWENFWNDFQRYHAKMTSLQGPGGRRRLLVRLSCAMNEKL